MFIVIKTFEMYHYAYNHNSYDAYKINGCTVRNLLM